MYPYIDAKIKLYLIRNTLNTTPLETSSSTNQVIYKDFNIDIKKYK